MDPKQTLLDAFDAWQADEIDECRDHLADYIDWRRKGGFEPNAGADAQAIRLYELCSRTELTQLTRN